MTKTPARERRRRRVASDEAHSWARDLRLSNPYAKSVLRALALYVGESGACTPGISTIAEDTDLSDDTVRKRLKFLEDVGAIARFARWRDEQGRENTEGRGKRTTDEIRLLIDADTDDIEARARGETPENDASDDEIEGDFSPRPQQGLNPDAEMRSPAPALGQPSQSRKGLISEPEPEDSPQAPLAGGCDPASMTTEGQAALPEHYVEFRRIYPETEVWNWDKVLPLFAALKPDEAERARAALPLWAAQIAKLRQKPMRPDRWLRERIFDNYPNAKLADAVKPPEPIWYSDDDPEVVALGVAHAIARQSPPNLRAREGHLGNWIKRLCPLNPDLVALTQFKPEDCEQFPEIVTEGSNEFGAWRTRLSAWIGHEIAAAKIWLEPHDPAVHDVPFSDPNHRFRKATKGFRVPWRWPPRKDGTTISEGEQG